MTTTLYRNMLPDHSIADKDFRESSFFRVIGRHLPDPSTIEHNDPTSQQVTIYPNLKLVIKYGPRVTVDEAITMLAVRTIFRGQVPVPELYGWRIRGLVTFIYMELIPGVTMEQRLTDPNFSSNDQEIVRTELRRMIEQLRQLKQEDTDKFIGSITRSPLRDRCFYDRPPAGPFQNLQEFYDWMEWLVQRHLEPSQRYHDPYLALMPKNSPIVFTHADIHPTNIMVSTSGPPRVLALIDWGQSGWYPDYWEFFKMCYTTDPESSWRKEWARKVVDVRDDEQDIMSEFTFGFGAL